MSYSKFVNELNDFYKDRRERGIVEKISSEDALNVVRDNWLKAGRSDELISFIIENWDSGNCDEFMKPLVEVLIENRDTNSFKRLWKGVLRHRTEKAWFYFSALKERFPEVKVEDLIKIDLSNFNQFSSQEDLRRRAAFSRQYTLDGISEFTYGLKLLNQTEEIGRANELYKTLYSMQRPLPKPTTDKRRINEEVFWELIQRSREGVKDQYEFLDKLKSALETFRPNELRRFQKLLLTKQQELYSQEHWALAYIVRGGCGDDEFDYFRVWAVSKGNHEFEAIKSLDTSRLKEIFDEDPQLEELLYISGVVFEDKTGEIMKEVRVKRSKLSGKEWNEDGIVTEFPVLCSLFNYAG